MKPIEVLKMLKAKIDLASSKYNCTYVIETSDIEAINQALVSCLQPVYDIDFGGHCKAGIKIENGKIVVIGAMNGYGDYIDSDKINIIERP